MQSESSIMDGFNKKCGPFDNYCVPPGAFLGSAAYDEFQTTLNSSDHNKVAFATTKCGQFEITFDYN